MKKWKKEEGWKPKTDKFDIKGSRSNKNKKLLDDVNKAVAENLNDENDINIP